MDPNGRIYMGDEDKIPAEDKSRLDGYLRGRAEADKQLVDKEKMAELRGVFDLEKSRGDSQRIHDLDAYIERLEPIVRHIAGMSDGYEYLKISRQLVLDAREALGATWAESPSRGQSDA